LSRAGAHDDLKQAITAILNDIAPQRSSVRPATDDLHEPCGERRECKRDRGVVSDPVITRVVASRNCRPDRPPPAG
jgi:hypothetical protein